MKWSLLLCLFPLLGYAQPQNIKIDETPALPHGVCEPSITINPVDPSNLVAGAILDRVYYSQDSGKTWTGDTLRSSYGVWGDPVLISDTTGAHYFFHLSDPTGENWNSEEILDRIVCQKSTDSGQSWNDGTFMGLNHPKDQDKQWATVDPNSNNIYVTWTQFDDYGSEDSTDRSNILFSKSEDSGNSWSEALRINELSGNCKDGDSTTEGAVPAVGPEGNIYVAWSNQNKIFFDRSEDGGKTWLQEDVKVAGHVGGWEIDIPGLQRANGMPVTVCDVSDGPHRGTIYINWVDDRNGNYDVWLSKSTDQGESWSEPLRINDDTTQSEQFFTWITCDPVTGHLYTVFYDRRHHDKWKTDVYLARSTDGGESWTNQKISEEPFKTNPFVFFGDYNHITAYDGIVRPIWTHMNSEKGTTSIWTALLNF